MQRRLAILVSTLVLAFGASVAPSPATPSANAMSIVSHRQVVPGSVNRTSINLEASYDARIRIGWDSRNVKVEIDRDDPQHLGRLDRSRGAQHRRAPPRRDDPDRCVRR